MAHKRGLLFSIIVPASSLVIAQLVLGILVVVLVRQLGAGNDWVACLLLLLGIFTQQVRRIGEVVDNTDGQPLLSKLTLGKWAGHRDLVLMSLQNDNFGTGFRLRDRHSS